MNKILIIDDDRELCALIKRSVQTEHIEADFCNTPTSVQWLPRIIEMPV